MQLSPVYSKNLTLHEKRPYSSEATVPRLSWIMSSLKFCKIYKKAPIPETPDLQPTT